MTTIADKLQQVQRSIQQASAIAGRAQDSVRLLAVSKTFGPQSVRQAFAAGQTAFGENYVQEALAKMEALADLPIEWHCIGPLQSNKTRAVAEHFDWVHTVDRLRVAERLSDQRPADMAPLQVCVQVNVDGGLNKSGVPPAEVLDLVRAVAGLPGLCLRGLMSIPEPREAAEMLQAHRAVRALFDAVAEQRLPGLTHWDTLSLGMSADLEPAIAAGSTLVRVGTGVFGGRGPAASGPPAP